MDCELLGLHRGLGRTTQPRVNVPSLQDRRLAAPSPGQLSLHSADKTRFRPIKLPLCLTAAELRVRKPLRGTEQYLEKETGQTP